MSELMDKVKELMVLVERIESDTEAPEPVNGKVELSTLAPGEVFKIGEYDFIVLNHENGKTEVISKGFMAENIKFGGNRNYKDSNVRKIIEEKIQPIIEAAIGADNLIEHTVDLTSVDMQNEFGSIECKVRLITFDEARKYNELIADKDLPDWWWTLTPWSTAERGWNYSVAVVCPSGDIRYNGLGGYGVRPFCILKSNIFVSRGEQ